MASVLIIDDHPALREAVAAALRIEGFEVHAAANGAEGVKRHGENPVDVVITDINMPEMDGIEAIHALLCDFPGTRIIAMSGTPKRPGLDVLEVARHLGVKWTLRKPFDDRELVSVVTEALNAAGEPPRRRRR
jgi:CheY-like chemotaxis protein